MVDNKNKKGVRLPIRLSDSGRVANDRIQKISWRGSKVIWTEVTEFVGRGLANGLLVIDEKAFWRKYKEIEIKEIPGGDDNADKPGPDEGEKT